VELIGEERVVRTEGILLAAIRQGRISVAEADCFKTVLPANRYAMSFGNFSELLWLLGRHRGSIGIGAARP